VTTRPKNCIIERVAGPIGRRDYCPAGRAAYDAASPECPSVIWNPLMKLKLVLALSALVAMPAFGQPQQGGAPPNAPKPTLAQVQKVIQIIRSDKVKTQQYCEIERLEQQIAEAEQKQDTKRVEELNKQVDDLGEKIGPEYVAMMDGLSQIDENSSEGKQIDAALASFEKLCTRK
jgi:TolA-binding protein